MPFTPIELQYHNLHTDRAVLNESGIAPLLNQYNNVARAPMQNAAMCTMALRNLWARVRIAVDGGGYEVGNHALLDQIMGIPPRTWGVTPGNASKNILIKLEAEIQFIAAQNQINL